MSPLPARVLLSFAKKGGWPLSHWQPEPSWAKVRSGFAQMVTRV